MDLLDLRNEIDQLDARLVDLFLQRMELAKQVAITKNEAGIPIYAPVREEEVLRSVQSQAGPEMSEYAFRLYATLFELSRDYQIRTLDSEVK